MNWNTCKREFIRDVEIDDERISSIKEMALIRLSEIKLEKLKNLSLQV